MFLIVCDKRGRIVYVGLLWSGSFVDFSIFKTEFKDIDFGGRNVYVDLGFQVIVDFIKNGKICIPHKRSKHKPLSSE
jgi:D-arabinose 1-dehydrogenase-like Zn-dependent alcohol dehydrogenase